jgi:hypothetical protein
VVALENVKECDWEATGNSLITGRGGEGKHTGRCHVAAMSIREEEEHCTTGSDGMTKHNDARKTKKDDVDTVHVERNRLMILSRFPLYS